jgi:peptidyl-prolyl cis-trans isomerase B (cyclophilin B)
MKTIKNNRINFLATTLAPIALSFLCATNSGAQMIDQDLLPPDVTLTNPAASGAAAGAAGGAVPGLGGAATATPAGQATAAAAAPAANVPTGPVTSRGGHPNIYTPPGAAPKPPAPPTGASGQGAPPAGAQSAAPPGAAPDVSHDPIAVIETNKGNITIRLFKSIAPKTVANFIELASSGFYNNLKFHRVEKGFCVQTGDPNGTGTGLYTDPQTKQPRFLPLETSPYLKHNGPGVVAMARYGSSPNSASCQFYITLGAQPSLDGQYSVFGGVISGMDVVNNIVVGDQMKLVTLEMP